jgi:hypothetical protein
MATRKKPEKIPDTNPPLSAGTYAIIALIGLAIGIGLLFFYVDQVPRLVETSSQNQLYYLLLIPWALACAAFLFGAMRSYARFTHRHLGSALELGGPVVLFGLVLLGGFKLVPQVPPMFDLTVRAHSQKEPIITRGRITIEFDSASRTERFDANGEANFKEVPARFELATLKMLPQVSGYEQTWQQHKPRRRVLDVALIPAAQPVTHLIGTIVPPPANWKILRVIVDGQPGEGQVDQLGRFALQVNGSGSDTVRLRIYAGNKLVYDDDETLPGPVTLTLH